MRDCQGSANEKHYTSSSRFPPMDFLFTTALLPPFLYKTASSALFSHCAFCRVNSVMCPAEPHRQIKRSVCASRASLQPSDRVGISPGPHPSPRVKRPVGRGAASFMVLIWGRAGVPKGAPSCRPFQILWLKKPGFSRASFLLPLSLSLPLSLVCSCRLL